MRLVLLETILIYNIENWEKITPHQFKDAYLAIMKDIQDPDFEEGPESNWNTTLEAIKENMDINE